jgi:hypothetical protein
MLEVYFSEIVIDDKDIDSYLKRLIKNYVKKEILFVSDYMEKEWGRSVRPRIALQLEKREKDQ